jgi:hypothetical protein
MASALYPYSYFAAMQLSEPPGLGRSLFSSTSPARHPGFGSLGVRTMPILRDVRPTRPLPPPGSTLTPTRYFGPSMEARWTGGGQFGALAPQQVPCYYTVRSAPGVRFGDLGQPGATIDLPDGSTHTVLSVNTSGEIFTTDSWQSATQPDGTERWINAKTGDVMTADGNVIPGGTAAAAAAGGGVKLYWPAILGVGAVILVVGYLAVQGAPVAKRRVTAAGRAARYAYARQR